jgi:predicted secreted protein
MYSFGNITEAAEAAEFFDVAAKSMEEMRESLRSIDECSLDSAGQWRKNLYFC